MNNEEINLKEIIDLFWRKKFFIIICCLLGAICGLVYTMKFVTPKFTATSSLILVQTDSSGSAAAVTTSDVTLNDKLIETYKELAKSKSVINEVIEELSLKLSYSKVKSEVNVQAVTGTQILKISVTDTDPNRATAIANTLSKVFSNKVEEIYKIDNINVVDEAETPTSPSNINHKKDVMIFTVAAFVLSIAIIFLISVLDTTVGQSTDFERTLGIKVLAEIPNCEFLEK